MKLKEMIGTTSPKNFKKLLDTGKFKLIDIRTIQELEYFGVISYNQEHIDVYQDIDSFSYLDRKGKYLIYCFHGNRSGYLLHYLSSLGFENVIDLEGGVENYIKSGFKLLPYKLDEYKKDI